MWLNLLILAAFFLRVYQIEAFGFWIDEALTPLRASYSISDIFRGQVFIQGVASQDTHPPLYYLLIHLTQSLSGSSDFALRYPSALLGALLVPLIFQLGRRLFGYRAGLAAALFVAVNPLQIWYGQEARMYTLLMATSTVTLYLLWPMVRKRSWRAGSLPGYLSAAALMLATHTSAILWITGHALLFCWIIWPERRGKLVVVTGVILGLAGIASLPWTVPRLFTGAEAGYTYLPPWIMVSDLFTGFPLGITLPAWPVLINLFWYGFVFATGFALWLLWQEKRERLLSFVAINLFSIIVVLAIVSLVKPLYQGIRHIMMAFPIWIVLMGYSGAFGVEWLQVQKFQRAHLLRGITGLLTIVLLLVGGAGSYYRLRTDPTVGKDHFREAVAFVEAQAGSRDLILYNDSIAMLIHLHYGTRADVDLTALPTYPLFATEDLDETLQNLTSSYDRVWFFPGPPNDGRDSGKIVQSWLNKHLVRLSSNPFFSRGTLLQVILFDSRPAAVEASENVSWSADGWPKLRGVTFLESTPQNIWLELYWEEFSFSPEQGVKLSLVGREGREWAVTQRPMLPMASPAGFSQPRRMFQFPLPEGLPPGEYDLFGQFIVDGSIAASDPLLLDKIVFEAPTSFTSAKAAFGPLELLDVDIWSEEIRPGYLIPIAPIWRTATDQFEPQGYRYNLAVIDPTGRTVFDVDKSPGPGWLTTWPAHTPIRDPLGIQIPADAPAGDYTLRWEVTDAAGNVVQAGGTSLWNRTQLAMGELSVDPWPIVSEMPPLENPEAAVWGDFAHLRGYNLAQDAHTLQLDLVWEVTGVTEQNLFVYVHVLDQETGEIATQQDWFPVGGLRPTNGWRPGEFIVDPHTLSLANLPAGEYQIAIGLYEPTTFDRPTAVENGVDLPDQRLILQEISLP